MGYHRILKVTTPGARLQGKLRMRNAVGFQGPAGSAPQGRERTTRGFELRVNVRWRASSLFSSPCWHHVRSFASRRTNSLPAQHVLATMLLFAAPQRKSLAYPCFFPQVRSLSGHSGINVRNFHPSFPLWAASFLRTVTCGVVGASTPLRFSPCCFLIRPARKKALRAYGILGRPIGLA
jgi:hypothetical protein